MSEELGRACACGLVITPGQQARHERSRWHQIANEARSLRLQGLSYADIARHFGLTRAYIGQKFRLIDENERAS